MTRLLPWVTAAVMFGVGCLIPFVGHTASAPKPACICPDEAHPAGVDRRPNADELFDDQIPATAPNEAALGPLHHDFILFDAPPLAAETRIRL